MFATGNGSIVAIGFVVLSACGIARADDVPLIGRPAEHFYGAVGERVTLRAELSSAEVPIDGELTWTLHINGLQNADEMRRPDLRQLSAFQDRFHIIDVPDPPRNSPGERVFLYRLRPRGENVAVVPEFLFRFFKPTAKAENPDPRRWFPLRSTEEFPIRVLPAVVPTPPAAVPLDVPEFARSLATESSLDLIPSTIAIALFALPPFALLVWRRYGPESARAVRHHRSRAARHALASLRRRQPPHAVVVEYLSRRFPLPPGAGTPTEVQRTLTAAGVPDAERVGDFLGRCDAVRFGGARFDLAPEAERLILDLEETT